MNQTRGIDLQRFVYITIEDRVEKSLVIKNLIGHEYSQHIIEAYKIKVLVRWIVAISKEDDKVCLYRENMMVVYLKCFNHRMKLPFNDF